MGMGSKTDTLYVSLQHLHQKQVEKNSLSFPDRTIAIGKVLKLVE